MFLLARTTSEDCCRFRTAHQGIKTKSGVLGLNETARYGRCEDTAANIATTFAETARAEFGTKVGVVTTARITHATPGGVYAHSADREW